MSTKAIKDLGDVALENGGNQQKPALQPHETAKVAVPEEFLHLFEHDDDEIILAQALRHPIGAYAIYATAGLVMFIVMVILGVLSANPEELIGTTLSGSTISLLAFVGVLFVSMVAIGSMLAAYVYRKSRMILTNQKIVIIRYRSIFSRQVSQLNILEIEDINVLQPTIVDRVIKTGTVTIETASEKGDYSLTWVQDPYAFSRLAVQSLEELTSSYAVDRRITG